MKLLISLLATLFLIAGCGNENEDEEPGAGDENPPTDVQNVDVVEPSGFPNLRTLHVCEKDGVTNTYELRFFDGEWTNCSSADDGSSCCGIFLVGENEKIMISNPGLSYAQCQAIIPSSNIIGGTHLSDAYKDREDSSCTPQQPAN